MCCVLSVSCWLHTYVQALRVIAQPRCQPQLYLLVSVVEQAAAESAFTCTHGTLCHSFPDMMGFGPE